MKTTRLCFFACGLALALFHSTPAFSGEIRDAIESANRSFAAAFLKGDSQAVAAHYTSDARAIPPGGSVVAGREGIAALWQGMIDAGYTEFKLETSEVESMGELAYEEGVATLVGRDGAVAKARYIVIWKHETGGWKLHRDIWNFPG